jgi:hypothetical protein
VHRYRDYVASPSRGRGYQSVAPHYRRCGSVAQLPSSAAARQRISTRARGNRPRGRLGRPRPSTLCVPDRCNAELGGRILALVIVAMLLQSLAECNKIF